MSAWCSAVLAVGMSAWCSAVLAVGMSAWRSAVLAVLRFQVSVPVTAGQHSFCLLVPLLMPSRVAFCLLKFYACCQHAFVVLRHAS